MVNPIEVSWLAVRPEFQRRGIGSALLEWGLERAKRHGCGVSVVAISDNAQAFYEHHGFKVIKVISGGKRLRRMVHMGLGLKTVPEEDSSQKESSKEEESSEVDLSLGELSI
jgi:GNAT superfamily N-acetyltransferase